MRGQLTLQKQGSISATRLQNAHLLLIREKKTLTNTSEHDRHLDLGCGSIPRNPYSRSEIYGIDVREDPASGSEFTFARANLVVDPIPFADNYFNSVSAFDFLEHVPRQIIRPQDGELILPFVRLMNEIWRVLIPGGMLYALTPAYPQPQAFQDPTHVNFITEDTHQYFCGTNALGAMYGFMGQFEAVRVEWAIPKDSFSAAPLTFKQKWRVRHRQLFRSGRGLSHLVWELRAIKSE